MCVLVCLIYIRHCVESKQFHTRRKPLVASTSQLLTFVCYRRWFPSKFQDAKKFLGTETIISIYHCVQIQRTDETKQLDSKLQNDCQVQTSETFFGWKTQTEIFWCKILWQQGADRFNESVDYQNSSKPFPARVHYSNLIFPAPVPK
jgi:hypothetical protein